MHDDYFIKNSIIKSIKINY